MAKGTGIPLLLFDINESNSTEEYIRDAIHFQAIIMYTFELSTVCSDGHPLISMSNRKHGAKREGNDTKEQMKDIWLNGGMANQLRFILKEQRHAPRTMVMELLPKCCRIRIQLQWDKRLTEANLNGKNVT